MVALSISALCSCRVSIAVLLSVFLTASAQPLVETICSETDKGKCLIIEDHSTSLDFYFSSDARTEITVTLKLELDNLESERTLPVTIVLCGPGQKKLVTLKAISLDREWDFEFEFKWRFGSTKSIHSQSVYRLPFAAGTSHEVIQSFWDTFSHNPPRQYSVDFAMPVGTPIHAARRGTVLHERADFWAGRDDPAWIDQGNSISIRHDDGTIGLYDHLRFQGVEVSVGDSVKEGDRIGFSGCTGYCSEPHLHFEVVKPVSGYVSQSLPLEFRTAEGLLKLPLKGRFYAATEK